MKKIRKRNQSIGDLIFDMFNNVFLLFAAIICTYPFYYVFIYSISNPLQAAKGGIYLFPKGFSLATYERMLASNEVLQATFVSVSRTVVGTSLTVICCSLFAYILQHPKLKLRRIIYRLSVVTMYMSAGLIPYYVLMTKIHFKNSFLLYVIPSALSMFNVILIKTYMEGMPKELEESASMDGASPIKVFTSIIFPLCKPILATIAIFSAVNQWNSWQDNMYLVSNPNLKTLQLYLLNYLNDVTANLMAMQTNTANITITETTPTSIRMTMTMIATMPILFVYPFFQKFFVKGIMLGSVKG